MGDNEDTHEDLIEPGQGYTPASAQASFAPTNSWQNDFAQQPQSQFAMPNETFELTAEHEDVPTRFEAVPYNPPIVLKSQVRSENWLSIPRQEASFDLSVGTLTIKPQPVYPARKGTELWSRLRTFIGTEEAQIFVPSSVIDALVRNTEPEIDITSLDSNISALVFEHVLTSFFENIESLTNQPIQVVDIVYPAVDTSSANFAFELNWPQLGLFSILMTPSDGLKRQLTRWIDQQDLIFNDFAHLPATLAFRAGITQVTLRELSELRAGDAIVLEQTWLPRQKVMVVTGERFVQTVTVSSSGLVLDDVLLNHPDGDFAQWTMEHIMTDTSPMAPAPEVAPVSDVQVKLVFELGRIEVSIGELEELGEGHVFDLGKPQTQAVDIVAGGRHIGEGELVRVAEGLGVRVTRIFQ